MGLASGCLFLSSPEVHNLFEGTSAEVSGTLAKEHPLLSGLGRPFGPGPRSLLWCLLPGAWRCLCRRWDQPQTSACTLGLTQHLTLPASQCYSACVSKGCKRVGGPEQVSGSVKWGR